MNVKDEVKTVDLSNAQAESTVVALNDLQLALVGGGIGDVVGA